MHTSTAPKNPTPDAQPARRGLRAFPGMGALRALRSLRWRGVIARHPAAADVLLAVLLALLTTFPGHRIFGHDPFLLVFQAALLLPLAWRRRAPFAVFGVIAAVAFAQWLYGSALLPGDVALLIGLYTVAVECSRRQTWTAAAVLGGGIVLAAAHVDGPERGLKALVGLSGLAIAAGVTGANIRGRRAYLATLEDRADRLERERDQQSQLAVARERALIAREMHDIVTHSLAVMVALADGAALATPKTPDKAVAAMQQVSGTGRQALTDMRRFLGVLRPDEPDALRHPQPGLAQLDALAAQVRAVGLPVRLRVEGETAAVPAGAQLTVYRLVQEALTNTLKHAAPGAKAEVRVRCTGESVAVEVRDDGIAVHPFPGGHTAGHGLDGMRERAAAYGATVEAGPHPAGGWLVATRLHLTETEEARS